MIAFRRINFAVFNVADSFVCSGAGLMMLHLIVMMLKEGKETPAELPEEIDNDLAASLFAPSADDMDDYDGNEVEQTYEEFVKETAAETAADSPAAPADTPDAEDENHE